jgi:HKD family nuclease
MPLPEGLYDTLVTQSLAQALQQLDVKSATALARLSADEVEERLSEAFARQLATLLDALRTENRDTAAQELRLVNDLLLHLREHQRAAADALDLFVSPPQVLRAIHHPGSSPEMPETGLAIPWLFTAGKGSPSLLNELRREMANCDQADLLVSFITVAGVRKILDILQNATAVDARGRRRATIRVLTTTYTGATEQEALDLLAKLPGCQVKVSLDGRRSRLHAKAWIFHRKTGFGSAYAGSANLSGAALLGGLEWTVKFTERGQGALFARAQAHFETLWNDGEFQRYDPADADHRVQLARALKRESAEQIPALTTFFDLEPGKRATVLHHGSKVIRCRFEELLGL